MKHLRLIALLFTALLTLWSCETENKYENFQRLRFVYHDYNAKIDADAEKFLPSGDRYSVLTFSDSALNFEFNIDFNAQSIYDKEAVLPEWLTWKKVNNETARFLMLDWENVENQTFANSVNPIVEEKQEYPIYQRTDGSNYYISPRKRLCLDAYLPRNGGKRELGLDHLGPSLTRYKIGTSYDVFKGEIIAAPIGGGTLKNSGVGVLSFRKSQIDSIASIEGIDPIQPYYLFQDQSQSFEILDNGQGYYSLVFYGNIDHYGKPAGWLQIGSKQFQLPRLKGNNSYAIGEIYELIFKETGAVGMYGFVINTQRLYR